MPLYVFSIDESKEWDAIVRSFREHDVYYLSGYVKAFQLHGDGIPKLFYFVGENIRGINVVMQRDISDDQYFSEKIQSNTFFDFITPYGYGGWLIEGDGDKSQMFDEYGQWCRAHNIVSEFVRYHPIIKNGNNTIPFYDVIQLGNTIHLDLSSPDVIWANLTSKNRNMIRKAQKSGVEIFHGQFPGIYATFKQIYNSTMDHDNAKAYYYFDDKFYDSIQRDLLDEAQVFWAELDGRIIAASIILATNAQMHYHLSGSIRECQHLAPTNLLLYKVALWGFTNGYKTLHLGGGVGSREDSLFKFKSSFNRQESNQFSIGRKIHLPDVYEKLTLMKNKDIDDNFFPKYRG